MSRVLAADRVHVDFQPRRLGQGFSTPRTSLGIAGELPGPILREFSQTSATIRCRRAPGAGPGMPPVLATVMAGSGHHFSLGHRLSCGGSDRRLRDDTLGGHDRGRGFRTRSQLPLGMTSSTLGVGGAVTGTRERPARHSHAGVGTR